MPQTFSIGVLLSGAASGAFRLAIGDTQHVLNGLQSTTARLQSRQDSLTQAMARYGQTGGRAARNLEQELQRVSDLLTRLQTQQSQLTNAAAHSQELRNQRMNLYGQAQTTQSQAQMAYSIVSPAIKQAITFDDKQIDMQITAKYDDKTRDALGNNIRKWSQQYNQLQDDMQDAAGVLISNKINTLDSIGHYMPDIARASTATRDPVSEWAAVAGYWGKIMNGKASEFRSVQNIMAYNGGEGAFKLADQLNWLKRLAPAIKDVAEGKEAIAEIGASLQITMPGARSPGEALNNFEKFLNAMLAEDTRKQFAGAGINLSEAIAAHQAKGGSSMEAMMLSINEYLAKQSPEAVAQFKTIMAMENDSERDAALASLTSNFSLGGLFADRQVMAFMRPMMQNMERFRTLRDGAFKAADDDMLAASYNQRLESPLEQTKRLVIVSQNLMLTLGKQLTPVFISTAQAVVPLLHQLNEWVSAHPEIVQGLAKAVGYFLVFKASIIGARMAVNLFLSPFASLWRGFVLMQTSWVRLQAAFSGAGRLASVARLFGSLARGALTSGRALAGALFRGLMVAGRGVLFLGRALMMTPIGLIITGIAAVAYLLYRYWGPVSAFFKRLWAQVTQAFSGAWSRITSVWSRVSDGFSGIWSEIKTAFSGGIAGVSQLILNWSPLGLFYKAFAGVLSWFGIDLPKDFTDYGGNLIAGLVNGISNKLAAAKETIVNFGGAISGWFKETLGIHSPSRVFASFGDNIVEGTATGINRSTPEAASASQQAAQALLSGASSPGLTAPGSHLSPLPGLPDAASTQGKKRHTPLPGQQPAIHVTFSPQINIKESAQTSEGNINAALKLSLHELEKIMERIMARRERREYA